MPQSTMQSSPSQLPAAAPNKRTMRVLYADDVRQLRDLLTIVLSKEGHTVECVADGLQALEKVTATPDAYDLVITDHHMPNMNGLDLVTHLRAMSFPGKIIVFSSELSQSVNVAYQQLKVDYVLPKPIFPATLRALLATL
jgi:two-component system chemotaxis response regulator CheY